MIKSEILFYYESRQNPNGDPDAENQPRLMLDDTIMVTDVRIKRTIRDYAKKQYGYELFVDFGEDGNPIDADDRAIEIAKKFSETSNDYIEILLKHTFDVPLFGSLITIRTKNTKQKSGSSQKLTGPLQFAMSHSVNKVNILRSAITSKFTGATKEYKEKQDSTMGKFYSVEYALIKVFGAINPNNLDKYLSSEYPDIEKNFKKYVKEFPLILWNGTNELITRSKFPQKSILFIQIDYKDIIYNDLPDLVNENSSLKGNNGDLPKELGEKPFEFDNLIMALQKRKERIEKIKIKYADGLDISEFMSKLKNSGIEFELLQ